MCRATPPAVRSQTSADRRFGCLFQHHAR
jgi:hypothetical protein